jgi:hypothetical protein
VNSAMTSGFKSARLRITAQAPISLRTLLPLDGRRRSRLIGTA